MARSSTSLSKILLAVWRCLRGAPRSASSTLSIRAAWASTTGWGCASETGAEGDMSAMSARFATVLRLTPSSLDILALGTPRASILRISCCVSRGTVIFLSSSGRGSPKSIRPGKT